MATYFKYKSIVIDEKSNRISDQTYNFVLDPILKSQFYLPTRGKLNDPTEGVFGKKIIDRTQCFINSLKDKPAAYAGLKNISDIFDEIYEHVNTSGVYSLTKNGLNELMWAHYANSHNGIAIEYDLELLTRFSSKPHLHFIDVKYQNTPPELQIESLKPRNIIDVMLGYKSLDWNYEDEHRIVLDNISGLIPHDYRAIKSITFGINLPDLHRKEIINYLSSRVTKFYEAYFPENSYSLSRKSLCEFESSIKPLQNHPIDWQIHLMKVNSSQKNNLVTEIESIINRDPHFDELFMADISTNSKSNICVKYRLKHESEIPATNAYETIYLKNHLTKT